MYICIVTYMTRVWINRVRLPILLAAAEQGKRILPWPRSRLKFWSRETSSAIPSRASLLISILRWCLLTGFLPSSAAASIYLFKSPYAIGSVPNVRGHAIAYRCHSLPRVRWYRASKPQGNSKRGLPWQVTIDQLIYASLSHQPPCWYEVSMLKIVTLR